MKQNNKNLSPAKYWRDNKTWSNLIGKNGTVLLATNIDNLYSYVLVEVDSDIDSANNNNKIKSNSKTRIEKKKNKIECMSEVNTFLQSGDKVTLQLRKLSESTENGLINYGIKAIKSYE